MWAQILRYKNQGIHWYHCNPTFLWKISFTLVRSLISALIWDIFGLWNRSDCRDYREKRIVIWRFLTLYKYSPDRSYAGMHIFVTLSKFIGQIPTQNLLLYKNYSTPWKIILLAVLSYRILQFLLEW